MKKEIGGGRIGSGNRMRAELHGYGRSTHDLSKLWRSSMAAGTLVPFINEVALPGDTWDINLDAEVRTHPTLGPLFGSYKLQLDVYEIPMRLYNQQLHNNRLGLGMNIQNVLFPQLTVYSPNTTPSDTSFQINPSNLLAYLGIKGLGYGTGAPAYIKGVFNAMPLLAYWDIYKNYYANRSEGVGYVINAIAQSTTTVANVKDANGTNTVPQTTAGTTGVPTANGLAVTFNASTVLTTVDQANVIIIKCSNGATYQPSQLFNQWTIVNSGGATPQIIFQQPSVYINMLYWVYYQSNNAMAQTPQLYQFALANIDTIRDAIMQQTIISPFTINSGTGMPYSAIAGSTTFPDLNTYSQQGLGIKTYQSDMFNNWMSTGWQTQISTATQVSTSGNTFTIDSLNMAKKVYDLLNRVMLSGGSYEDWIETVYDDQAIRRTETPMYHGGLSKEILFQEVIALAASGTQNTQYLGTQAGKGIMGKKHKGGKVVIHVREPSYIMGIVSITPRIDYSQGNKWHMRAIMTPNDLHKPALDEIGFQNLITDWMASWDTTANTTGVVTQWSAGVQPAWMQYMTNVNELYGNFAIPNNEMFMTLNRRYSQNTGTGRIADLTTYIDPSKFNFIYAQTSYDSQNFWTQIAVNMEVRRKMSAKLIPNL